MLIIALLIACSQDVSIMKIGGSEGEDSANIADSDVVVDVEDTSDYPESETSFEGFGGLLSYDLTQVACPPCFGISQEITVKSELMIYDPMYQSQLLWAIEKGTCSNNFSTYLIGSSYENIGNYINVISNGLNFTLNRQNNNSYANYNLLESQYQRDSVHDLYLQDYYISSFVSIHGFDYIEPYEMLYVDPTYAFAAPIYKNNAAFYWGPSGSDSMFYITIDIYSNNGSQQLGSVTCSEEDVGFMQIPQQYLSQYPTGSLLAIKMTRYKFENYELNLSNSYLETYMKWEVVGTGFLQ